MNKILIYIEQGKEKNSIELLEVASIIGKGKDDYQVYGVGLALNQSKLGNDFDQIINIRADFPPYDMMNVTKVLAEIYEKELFDCILVSATTFGRMLAPRLAMTLRTGLVADVTEISMENNQLMMIRPAYTGKIMAAITCDTTPVMMSIRPSVFHYQPTEKKETIWQDYEPTNNYQPSIRQMNSSLKSQSADIRDSQLLVSCGGGMNNQLTEAEQLAEKLHGKLAVSRRPVDNGVASRAIQVGQSGKIVSPKIYIALGIFGSQQHIDGLKGIESIISVNIDKHAPINHLADLVVEGDAHQFVQLLLERIDKEDILAIDTL